LRSNEASFVFRALCLIVIVIILCIILMSYQIAQAGVRLKLMIRSGEIWKQYNLEPEPGQKEIERQKRLPNSFR
jgi:hypothetical protein